MKYHAANPSDNQALATARRCLLGNESDSVFIDMLVSFRSTGGLARALDVFTLFKSRNGLGAATLPRWRTGAHSRTAGWTASARPTPLMSTRSGCYVLPAQTT